MIKIYINNKEYTATQAITLANALDLVEGLPKQGIAIAVNLDVIPASQWNEKRLNDGDKITIIKAFYGG